jgi:uncharacterized glyoxalase superfamily protein PhnB/drug/metabolite transporter (DMT)-like permease
MSSPYLQTRAVQSRGLLVGSVLAGGSMVAVGGSVAVSSLITDYPVFSAQAVRYAAGALLLVGWANLHRLPRVRTTTKERVRLVVIALTGLAGFNVAIVIALRSAEPAAVGVVVGCVPLVLAIVGPLLERRAPSVRILVAATVVVLGAALVQGVGRTSWAAFGLSLVALAGESAYSLVAIPLLPRLGPVGVSIRICAIAALILAVTAIAVDGRSAFETPSWQEAVSVAFLAVVVTAMAFVAWYESIGRLGVERTGLFAGLLPVSALLVGAAVGSESVDALPLAGTLVVGAGITFGLTGLDSRVNRTRRTAMPSNPPEGFPRITPYLLYEDCEAALEFLAKAFGFTEDMRVPGPEGKVTHAEMRLKDGVIMMGRPGDDYQNPSRTGRVNASIYVYVDDVDKHFEQAKGAGAKVISEPQDQFYGDRSYMAEDPQGQQWSFATNIKDFDPETMKPPS